jgi:hypothetical protein
MLRRNALPRCYRGREAHSVATGQLRSSLTGAQAPVKRLQRVVCVPNTGHLLVLDTADAADPKSLKSLALPSGIEPLSPP